MIYSEECKLEDLTYKNVPISFAGIEFCGKEVNRNPVYFTRINNDGSRLELTADIVDQLREFFFINSNYGRRSDSIKYEVGISWMWILEAIKDMYADDGIDWYVRFATAGS